MVKRLFSIIIICFFVLNLVSCSDKKKRYESEFLTLFDTMTKIVAYTDNKATFTKYSQLIYDKLSEYHKLYDIYNNYDGINNIKTINDNAGITPIKVDKKIIDLLLFSKSQYNKTSGKVNVAFGSVLKIWHEYRTAGIDDFEHASLPPMSKLKVAEKYTDIDKMIIDEPKSTVYLEDKNMSIDVGAIAKGYATERVSEIAIKSGFTSGLISVGGNVRAIGFKEGSKKLWNVGIQNPNLESDNTNLLVTYLTDSSLVTSGIYERYYTVNGKNYHHIINPETLMPSVYFKAVTIICKDSGIADALSTAIFNMPFEQGKKYIDDLANTEALWVLNNDEIKYSKNFKDFLKK